MEPLFTEEQLNSMSRENIIALMKTMQKHQQEQENQIRVLTEKTKELEFLNAMLSDCLTLAQRKRFGASSATVYSITETALLNGLKPYNYLSYVLEKMKDLGAFPAKEEMIELLPWSSSLPEDCRSKLKK